jgi:hypothetical protein
MQKMYEALYDNAFTTHTYKHTTMGFLKDIEAMPKQFAYSRQFFDRYYRPDNVTSCWSSATSTPSGLEADRGRATAAGRRDRHAPPSRPSRPQTKEKRAALGWPARRCRC